MPQFNVNHLPNWYNKILQRMAAEAESLTFDSNTGRLLPYTTYPQDRVAPFNSDILSAQGQLRNFTAGDQRFQNAGNILDGMQYSFPDHYQRYMNPYNEAVTNRIAELGNRNFREQLLPALEAKFVRLGQHGSSKHREQVGRMTRDLQSEIMGRQAESLRHGYGEAAKSFEMEQSLRRDAANAQLGLGAKEQGRGLFRANLLQNIGQENMAQEQRNRDMQYQNYLAQKNHHWDQLSTYANAVQGIGQQVPVNSGQYVYEAPPLPKPQQSFANNVMNVAGGLLTSGMGFMNAGARPATGSGFFG